MSELRLFTRVMISAPGVGACAGRIEDIRGPVDLPDIGGLWSTGEEARTILMEWGVERIAMISYPAAGGEEYLFAALEIAGEWYDLKRQRLTLEVIGQYEWPQQPG